MSAFKTITDQDIQALVDNELDWELEKEIRETIRLNFSYTKRYKEILAQKKLIQQWFKNNS